MIDLNSIDILVSKYDHPWSDVISSVLKDIYYNFLERMSSGIYTVDLKISGKYIDSKPVLQYVSFGQLKDSKFSFAKNNTTNSADGLLQFLKTKLVDVLELDESDFDLVIKDGRIQFILLKP